MHLYLIRHAQSLNNALPEASRVEDPSLTEIGHAQAAHVARHVATLNLTRLITSPFRRALQTAGHLRAATGLTPEVRVDLHERGGCMRGPSIDVMVGRPGMNRSEILAELPGCDIETAIDGVGWWKSRPYESEERALARAERLLARTREEFAHTDDRVAFVTHGDFKLLLLACFHMAPLGLAYNGSVSSVVLSPARLELREYNCVSHLPDDLLTW